MSAKDGRPYFTIDGVEIATDDGRVIYQERRDPKLLEELGIDPNSDLIYEFRTTQE